MNSMTIPASSAKPAARSLFGRWGRAAFRGRRVILVAAVLVAALGGVWGAGVFGRVQTAGGFDAPGSQSPGPHLANRARRLREPAPTTRRRAGARWPGGC